MTSAEKIEYVRDMVQEEAAINPRGTFRIRLYTLTDGEEGPTIISALEQWKILLKFEEEGFIKNLSSSDDKRTVWLTMSKKKKTPPVRRGNMLSHIKTTDQLLQNRELFEKFLKILGDTKQLQPKHKYTFPTNEQNDDLIQLLIDLGLVEYDWKEMKKQTHRAVGNRIIEFSFEGEKIIPLINRISGKNGRVRKEALELIAHDIGTRFSLEKIVSIFSDIGIPESMFISDTKWRAVFYVLSFYSTDKYFEGWTYLLKAIEKVVHPLAFGGDEKKSEEAIAQYNTWLKYDNVSIDPKDGKAYISANEEEQNTGQYSDDWYDADGNVVEAKAYLVLPDHVASLWIFWTQVILVISAYEANSELDRDQLEKLYLELIGETEALIAQGMCGSIKKSYSRPFNSLATAAIEARAKKADGPYELAGVFLVQIGLMEPDPSEVTRAREKHADLIKRVAAATRAIGGEKLNILKLTHEQALFILKLYMSSVLNILEATASGPIKMTDSELNAKYVLFTDAVQEILNRADFSELKKSMPEYLPEHLYINVDEMETWWDFGQAGIISFIGDIESAWVRDGQQTFPISLALNSQLAEAEELATKHKKRKNERWGQITKNLDKMQDEERARNNPPKSPPPAEPVLKKIIHEHRHHFQNSIQEKDLTLIINEDEKVVRKNGGKKVTLPKFPRTEWVKVSITFLDETNILLSDGKSTKPSSFEGLGCDDGRNGKADENWNFLLKLARGGGQTSPLTKKERESEKKKKQKITDILRKIFHNDTDPFEAETGGVYKAKFNIKYNTGNSQPAVNRKYADLNDVFSEMTASSEESVDE